MAAFDYEGKRTGQISFPLGGIGTGCVGLAGNGRLVDWEIFGRPNKGGLNGFSHFAVKAERKGRLLDARVLHGDLEPPFTGEFSGSDAPYRGFGFGPHRENMAGAPHFEQVKFRGQFPFAELRFRDASFPGRVSLTAFNPFIPLNETDSGIPAAFFEISLENPTKKAIDYTVVCALGNPLPANNRHSLRRSRGVHLLHLSSDAGAGANAPGGALKIGPGDLAAATDAAETSGQQFWFRGAWFDNLEVYWRDLIAPGKFPSRRYPPDKAGRDNTGMLAAHLRVAPGKTGRARFVISWRFPTLEKYWDDPKQLAALAQEKGLSPSQRHHYATIWQDAPAAARYALRHWDRLYAETRLFQKTLFASSLPRPALEAVSANLAVLKTPTVLRLEDGAFYG
ncbi:GH116 family glycosyl-hydrolase, partial [Candidatus Sumerlaeota bacterium]